MSVRILVDSASDLMIEEATAMGVELLSLTVRFGEKEYPDGRELTHEQFFELLSASDALPTTSQYTPFQYEEAFRKATETGDSCVCITLSSKLSGCWQNACLAAQEFEGQVYVVDSENACIGERLLTEWAVRLRDMGKTAAEIAETLEKDKKRIRLLALLDTLKYLQKGGRLSAAAALAGALLAIKPVITLQNGEVAVLGKARGAKNGSVMLTKFIESAGGIDADMPYTLAYSGASDELLMKYVAENRQIIDAIPHGDRLPVCTIGSAIGTHVGPGAIGTCFFAKETD